MAERRPFTLGLVQAQAGPDRRENLERAARAVERAAADGAEVICLQELFADRYFCQTEDPALFDLAETVPGPCTERMAEVARRTGAALVVPVFERRAPGVFHNTAAVLGRDGEIIGLYRKMHIPDDPGYCEKFYFAPGDLGFRSFETHVGRIGVLICWDQWFPEAARLTAMAGAEVLVYPTAIGWHPAEKADLGREQLEAWQAVQRGHAVANGVYVAAANRVGLEVPATGGPGIEFWGASLAFGPMGEVLAQAPADREQIVLVEVDPSRVEECRRGWPFFRDRRIDAYQGLLKRFG
ncbi:MAG: carbon-nitrogen hydrolase [Desulfovibrionaceae bacterium]|nr:carbon-nitrogen hydrolase [Desulfovibrionaceae bacterium]